MKIDIHNREGQYNSAVKKLQKADILESNKETIMRFLKDAELGKTIKKGSKKKLGKLRLAKYPWILTILAQEIKKPFEEANQEDMESFITRLESNKIKPRINVIKKECYSDNTKLDFKICIKKFYKWLLGNNMHYPEIVEWFDTHEELKDVPAISLEETEKMAEASNTRDKAMIMTDFDSGARAEEFLNIKLGNLTEINNDNGTYYSVRIEHETSKTKGRTIDLPIASKYIRAWLQQHPKKDDPDSQLFPLNYNAFRMIIKRKAKKILNKEVTPHVLRHSSATYYASRLTSYQMCYRYGWSMSSDMPSKYIDREGIEQGRVVALVNNDKMEVLEKQNKNLKQDMARLNNNVKNLQYWFELMTLTIQQDKNKPYAKEFMSKMAENKEVFHDVLTKEDNENEEGNT